jgi:hypothetical protein
MLYGLIEVDQGEPTRFFPLSAAKIMQIYETTK